MSEATREVNFDGLVGPTHNYGGLSTGNIASVSHGSEVSHPKEAALQGLKKMKALHDRGFVQGIFPFAPRPDIEALRRLGFTGSVENVLRAAQKEMPQALHAAYSASCMWTANAATFCPSADSQDGKAHFTPANLTSKFHRSLEVETTSRILRAMFPVEKFHHHAALPPGPVFSDEGAANHTRLAPSHASAGIHLFVYGRGGFTPVMREPKRFPARQTLESVRALARNHTLRESDTVFVQQNPDVIDAGVFHNDVIAVGNRGVLLFHEEAFEDWAKKSLELGEKYEARSGGRSLVRICVPKDAVTAEAAVKSYLFNSQLLDAPDGSMFLLSPIECQEEPPVANYLKNLTEDTSQPIREVVYFDLRQSMHNGGGPACLRMRVVLTQAELQAVPKGVILDPKRYEKLVAWVERNYRDRLSSKDLIDPKFAESCWRAADELTQILELGSLFPFQR